jgi:predicted amidophosphoribosyltransferase
VPSSAKSFAKRGFVPAQVIANRLARNLKLVAASKALWLNRIASDQAGLDQEARAENLIGAMKASVALSGKRVLLVDDIVTTGSSLVEAARAASVAGAEVVGFATLAETILKIAPGEPKRV